MTPESMSDEEKDCWNCQELVDQHVIETGRPCKYAGTCWYGLFGKHDKSLWRMRTGAKKQ